MKNIISVIATICILSGCSYESMYGETGRELDLAYYNLKGKELHCLGQCLLYDSTNYDPCDSQPMKYQVNDKYGYIEDYEKCEIVDSITQLVKSNKAPCWKEKEHNKNSIASSQSIVKVVGASMGSKQIPSKEMNPQLCLARLGNIKSEDSINKVENVGYLKVELPVASENVSFARNGKIIKYVSLTNVNKNKFGSWDTLENATIFQENLDKKKQKIQNQIAQKQKALQKEKDAFSKKIGYKWCDENYTFWSQNNCIFSATDMIFNVLQQTSEGTLVQFKMGAGPVFLITKNNKDYNLADGDFLNGGVFVISGTYKYTNVLGSTSTVSKIRRIE